MSYTVDKGPAFAAAKGQRPQAFFQTTNGTFGEGTLGSGKRLISMEEVIKRTDALRKPALCHVIDEEFIMTNTMRKEEEDTQAEKVGGS